ncbi:MAG: right-handed parallel beta-helix repeat-containing protein, partial [Alistipes sp.]|nr:right-handed parallel beta-helix repeat-containing protein [Candidatus Minthomonas equi]
EYVDARMDRWAEEDAPFLHGYWGFDWFDMYNPVSIDTVSKSMTIDGEKSPYGYRDGCRFRGVNLLCELDSPGEYWVDRRRGKLLWYAPDGFDGEGTSVSSFSGEAMMTFSNCSDICVEGIEMYGGRGGAVKVDGGSDVVFKNCSFFRFAQDVAVINGGSGHKFLHCRMAELGCAGIILQGGDRTTLEPAGFEVSDCTIETLSLYRKTYQPCIRFGGCGLTITHNLFRNCPSSALRLDGNDILVEYNRFEDLVLESDDQGGIDIFNNYNFRGIRICHNYFHNIGDPKDNIAGGVRFDDRISGMLVEGNVFNHCGSRGFGGVQIHGGQDNLITGNIFYDCTYALSHTAWDADIWFERSENDCAVLGLTSEMDALTPMGKLYLERYPDIAHVFDRELVNRNYLKGNLVVNTPELITRGVNIVSEDNTFIMEDSGQGLEYWISDEVLAEYGITSVGFDRMGPRVSLR